MLCAVMRARDAIKEARLARGWSPYRLAKESGVNHQAIRNIENGRNDPSWQSIRKLAKTLDLNLEELARGE